MSGPKHLWSGDWRNESQQPASEPLRIRDPEADAASAPETPRPRRLGRRQLVIALVTGVAAAAVTVGLVVGLGGNATKKPGSHKHPASKPAGPQSSGGQGLTPTCSQASPASCSTTTQTPTATPVSTGPTADWMGMQIVTSPTGVVVETVRLGSPGDQAGFEPGDQIIAINGHLIGAVSELRTDTSGVQIGGPVTIAVQRQSVTLKLTSIRMTQRPTIHP
jgi:membrane-associated protease RseP (regulator of RpoE activity)